MIGVCIRYAHENYGGMLQACATLHLLQARGLPFELIRYRKRFTPLTALAALPRLLNGVLLNDKREALAQRLGALTHPAFAANHAQRMAAFARFRDARFTALSPVFTGYAALCAGANRYTAVLSGSDQLWSPAGLPTGFYNLRFVPDPVRRLSYASSFGVAQISWYQRRRTRAFLTRIPFISMREQRGSALVRALTGREVPTLADPVLLLDAAAWAQLIPPAPPPCPTPYVLAYFLGRNAAHREAVREAARVLGCAVVTLRHLDRYVPGDEHFGDFAPYDVDPADFLNLLRGAAYVCTDSYHGALFSVIHEKPFVVFDRYAPGARHSKNSRIDTLCESLGLSARRFAGARQLAAQLRAPLPMAAVNPRVQAQRAAAHAYLDCALAGL